MSGGQYYWAISHLTRNIVPCYILTAVLEIKKPNAVNIISMLIVFYLLAIWLEDIYWNINEKDGMSAIFAHVTFYVYYGLLQEILMCVEDLRAGYSIILIYCITMHLKSNKIYNVAHR